MSEAAGFETPSHTDEHGRTYTRRLDRWQASACDRPEDRVVADTGGIIVWQLSHTRHLSLAVIALGTPDPPAPGPVAAAQELRCGRNQR